MKLTISVAVVALVVAVAQIPYQVELFVSDEPPSPEVVETTLEDMIAEKFPEDPELFIAIAKAESNLIPTAYNPEAHNGCNGSYSIMQVSCIHYEARGIYGEDRFDIETNLQVAREVYEESGVRAWGSYLDNRFLAFYETM